MLELARGLPAKTLAAIADLENRVLAADGGRLKLEWGTLRARTGHEVEDVLWWHGDQLLGFAGLYSFGPEVEVAGMVDPGVRRQGIGSVLLDAVLQRCRERGRESVLMVVPRRSVGGQQFAARRGGQLHHAEHALELLTDPSPVTDALKVPSVQLRGATREDVPALSAILEAAFGHSDGGLADRIDRPNERTWMVCTASGESVGTLHLSRDEHLSRDDAGAVGVYGFAIVPAFQGQGIGRHVLLRTCQRLRSEGVSRIHLETGTTNDRALGLYTSLGFTLIATEDYFQISTA